jgi:hypothetical protein
MSVIPYNDRNRDFAYGFLNMVATWNHLESAAKDIVTHMIGKSTGAMLAAHHLGNTSLTDAIRVGGQWTPAISDHLAHFANGMDTLRAYRNYYVHGIIGVGKNPDFGPIGLVIMLEVRGKIKLTEKAVKLSDLTDLTIQMNMYRIYGVTLAALLEKRDDLAGIQDEISSLEKPIQPKTLVKNIRGQSEPPPPHQS